MMETEHKTHVHCCICNECMEVPINLLIDIEIKARKDKVDLMGMTCDDCL